MRVALFGSGGMGQIVKTHAQKAGHDVTVIISSRHAALTSAELGSLLAGQDVAIDFSVADAVVKNVSACATAGLPIVEGTTGWNERESEIRSIVESHDAALIYGANFSIGVNLFYRIVENAADLFAGVSGYAPFIEEAHHSRKRDAPSGTALRLRELMGPLAAEVPIASTRAGYIPGTHVVGFDSIADQITLTHTARSREGFAAGALLAANWIVSRKGVYRFSEMLDEVISPNSGC